MRSLRARFGSAMILALCVGCSSDDDAGNGSGGTSGSAGTSGAGGTVGSGAGGTVGTAGTGAIGGTGGAAGSGASNGTAGTGASSGTAGTGATGGTSGSAGTGGSAGNGMSGSGGAAAAGAGGSGLGGTAGGSAAGSGGSSDTTPADFCNTALFCDDFEDHPVGAVPGSPWATRLSNGGAITVDGSQRASGEKSVKVTTPMASTSKAAMLRLAASVLPVDGNAFYGRMLYRLEAAPTASVHWNLITGIGTVPGQTYRAEYRYGGQQPVAAGSQLMANYETPDWYGDKSTPGSDCWHHSNQKVLPVAEWACVEWKFESNQMHFWLNGAALDDLTVVDRGQGCVNAGADLVWTAPTFTQLDLGWESYQADDARTAYIDDVVIATTRIGCPSRE